VLQFVEEAFDQIALSVKRVIDRTLDLAVAAGRDVSPSAATFYQIDNGAGVVTAVGDEVATWLESIKIGAMVLSDDWPCDSTIRTGIPC
jgi:hypothetical protein